MGPRLGWQDEGMPAWEMPPVGVAELAALERDYRYGESRLVRQRSQVVRLAYELETQVEIARAVCCSVDTVRRSLALYRAGGRAALRRARQVSRAGRGGLNWQRGLGGAVRRGAAGWGGARPGRGRCGRRTWRRGPGSRWASGRCGGGSTCWATSAAARPGRCATRPRPSRITPQKPRGRGDPERRRRDPARRAASRDGAARPA